MLLLRLSILRRLLRLLGSLLRLCVLCRRNLLMRLTIHGRLLARIGIVHRRTHIGRRRRRLGSPLFGVAFGQAAVDKEVAAVCVALVLGVVHIFDVREARRNDGDFHFVVDIAVDAGAEDDVCGVVNHALHEGSRRLHFVHGQIVAADNVEDDALCALDGRGEQRAVDRKAHSLDDPVFTLRNADAHVREPLVFQDGAHVRKVEVDERGIDDEVGNAADTLFEDLVRNAESFHHRRIFGNDAGDLVVRDDNERIDILFEVFQPLRRIVHALFAFKAERFGDDGNGKDLQIARDLGDDGSCPRTCAAAHACRNKEEVGIFHRFRKHFFTFFGRRSAHFGFSARAEPLRQRRTDLDLVFRFG